MIEIETIIIGTTGTLFGIALTHYFSQKRKVDELLFNARKKTYGEFMKNFGMDFAPEQVSSFSDANMENFIYERKQKINKIFAECRLLANPLLEEKLRHLYELMIDEQNIKLKKEKRERDYIGYEVEALMRHDLKVITKFEVFFWSVLSTIRRFQLKKNRT